MQSFRRNYLAKHGVSEVVVLATLTAFIGYANKFLRIDNDRIFGNSLPRMRGGGDYDNLCQTWLSGGWSTHYFWQQYYELPLSSFHTDAKSRGIFVPSMAIGATFGRMVEILVKALYNTFPHWSMFSAWSTGRTLHHTTGTYAFLGAAAALAGVTRITVAVVVIMFELTGALTYILPTMIVVGITKGVADCFRAEGLRSR